MSVHGLHFLKLLKRCSRPITVLRTCFLSERKQMGSSYVGQNCYLIYYAQEHTKFRFPELRSLCQLLRISLDEDQLVNPESPFLLVTLPNTEAARDLVRRSVLMKSCFECWAHSRNWSEMLSVLGSLPRDFIKRYSDPGSSFRLRIHAYGKKLRTEDIARRIQDLRIMAFSGNVDLVNPTHSFHVLEDYGGEEVPEPAAIPEQIFFGRWIADSGRDAVYRFRLDQRCFIGTTSMDPLLALVMANQALVTKNSLIYDPFVGTGSLLIAAAHFGAFVMGADIDQTLLHGRGKSTRAKNTWRKRDESILANFKQYGLQSQYLDVLIADIARNVQRVDFQFDAIISDPPYGVREATARVGNSKTDYPENNPNGGPCRLPLDKCNLNDLILKLVDFAARHLRIGGRLVYWLPVVKDEYHETVVPRHDCLGLISNSEQHLAGMASRRLITMEKIGEWKPEHQVTFAMDVYTNTFRERYFMAKKNTSQSKNTPRQLSY